MKWILDTNVISARMRQHPMVLARWHAVQRHDLLIPAIVIAEGLYGARKAGSRRWFEAWQTVVGSYEVVPFDTLCADRYAVLRADLERRGCMIGLHDCKIAATALAWQATHPADKVVLVTNNLTEFQRVPDLQVEDWSGS